ncbi:MAG: hypothetical protein KGY50_01985 [Candidatus Thermoplasmatota archaeon]|nr:hypothetical protein [Candidatus Thermoplasmatota archaeon]
MRRKTLSIQCNQCGKEIYSYVKIGKGRVWHCWKKRILKDNSTKNGKKILCSCGNLIGKDDRVWIKLKQHNIHIE